MVTRSARGLDPGTGSEGDAKGDLPRVVGEEGEPWQVK